jgi:hypothetical protein
MRSAVVKCSGSAFSELINRPGFTASVALDPPDPMEAFENCFVL